MEEQTVSPCPPKHTLTYDHISISSPRTNHGSTTTLLQPFTIKSKTQYPPLGFPRALNSSSEAGQEEMALPLPALAQATQATRLD